MGSITIAYPEGLPNDDAFNQDFEYYQSIKQSINQSNDQSINQSANLRNHEHGKLIVDENTCQLWFAGKLIDRSNNQSINQFIGNNEKVFLKTKLENGSANQSTNQNGPARNTVDTDTQKKMIEYWNKQQSINQSIDQSNSSGDDYLNSEWANPNLFKQRMNGIGDIRLR